MYIDIFFIYLLIFTCLNRYVISFANLMTKDLYCDRLLEEGSTIMESTVEIDETRSISVKRYL